MAARIEISGCPNGGSGRDQVFDVNAPILGQILRQSPYRPRAQVSACVGSPFFISITFGKLFVALQEVFRQRLQRHGFTLERF